MDRRGLLHLLAAAALFSVMSLLVKVAGERLPSPMMVLARGLVTLVASLLWLRGRGLDWRGHDRPRLFLRGLFGFGGLLCFFFAITRLPLAEVTVIHSLNPVITALLAAALLGERTGLVLWAAIGLCLAGVTVVARPATLFGGTSALDPMGVAAALGGAFFAAAAYVTVRRLRATEDPLVIVFWFSLVAVPLSVPMVVPVFVWPEGHEWLLLLAIGLVTQVAQVMLTRGLVLVPAGPATTVTYLQVAFAAFWGALLFDEHPTPSTWAGAALVFVGTLVLVVSSRRGAG